jgi:hypothetical protein
MWLRVSAPQHFLKPRALRQSRLCQLAGMIKLITCAVSLDPIWSPMYRLANVICTLPVITPCALESSELLCGHSS